MRKEWEKNEKRMEKDEERIGKKDERRKRVKGCEGWVKGCLAPFTSEIPCVYGLFLQICEG